MLFNDELASRLDMSPLLDMDSSPSPSSYTDSNNNSSSSDSDKSLSMDKYSLRPRSMRRRKNSEEMVSSAGAAATTTSSVSSSKQRSSGKAKQKPAPLSKYRRRTANARERSRMREINQAFEALRRVVPQLSGVRNSPNEKLTKITTLRLAMKYISTLSATLSDETPDLLSDCSDLDCLLLESDGESLPLNSDFSDHSLASDFPMDFCENDDLPSDFAPLSPDLSNHISSFDPFLSDFS